MDFSKHFLGTVKDNSTTKKEKYNSSIGDAMEIGT